MDARDDAFPYSAFLLIDLAQLYRDATEPRETDGGDDDE